MWLLFEFYLSTDIDNIKVIEQKKKHTKENLVFLDGFGEGGDSK